MTKHGILYVVIERELEYEDTVVAVFSSKEQADSYATINEHYHVDESYLNEIDD